MATALVLLSGSLLTASPAALAGVVPAARPPAARPLAAGDAAVLRGVFCTSPSSCWAVGAQKGKSATLNQVFHSTGGDWFPVTVPDPAGQANGASNILSSVRCGSTTSCWAVGYSIRNGGPSRDQILHWNGMKWTTTSAPTPGGTKAGDINQLNDVACVSARDCWAVGHFGIEVSTTTSDSEVELTQILHWTGEKWALVPSPNPAGHSQNRINILNTVRCVSASDCWAAGTATVRGTNFVVRNLMLHWSGKKWTSVKVPNPGGTASKDMNQIQGLGCTSAANCWAVGFYGKGSTLLNQTLHWNGKKWAKVTTPNPDGTGPNVRNQLNAVACVGASDCWAIGWSGGISNRPGLNQALQWLGNKWSVVPMPDPGGTTGDVNNIAISIRCTSKSNCWAVGLVELSQEEDDQFLHWNGALWQF